MIFRRAFLPVVILVLATNCGICGDLTMGRYDPAQTSYTSETLRLPLVLNWELTLTKYPANAASPVVVGK